MTTNRYEDELIRTLGILDPEALAVIVDALGSTTIGSLAPRVCAWLAREIETLMLCRQGMDPYIGTTPDFTKYSDVELSGALSLSLAWRAAVVTALQEQFINSLLSAVGAEACSRLRARSIAARQ